MRQKYILFYVLLLTFCNNVHLENCNYCNCTTTKILFNCECTNKFDNSCSRNANNILLLSTQKIQISSDVFLTSIEELYVHDVCIKKLYFPQKLDKLTRLKLNFCNTTAIDENSFSNVRKLEELTLENNNIITFNEEAFKYVQNLYYLNMKNNSIQYFSDTLLKDLRNLMYLNLAMNNIELLNTDVFLNNNKLEEIYLNKNNIEKLPHKIFDGLTNVIEINLGDNQIKDLPLGLFSNLNNLKKVNLQNNKLNSIRFDVFKNSLQIEEIYLDGNNIQQVDLSILNLPLLKYINIPDSSISCDCKMRQFFNTYKDRKISGNIQCSQSTLSNKKFSDLTIVDFACAPKILNCFDEKNENLTKIACLVYGDPLPQTIWIANDFEISNNTLYNVNINNVDNNILWSNLTILNGSVNGSYKIEAQNNGGLSYIEYSLTVYSIVNDIQSANINIKLISVIITTCLAVVLAVLILFFLFKHCKKSRSKNKETFSRRIQSADYDSYSDNYEFKDVIIRTRIRSTNNSECIDIEPYTYNFRSTNNSIINCIPIQQLMPYDSDLNVAQNDNQTDGSNTTEHNRRTPEHSPLIGRSLENVEEILFLPEPDE